MGRRRSRAAVFFVEERSADPLDRALAATQSDGPKDADEATPVAPVRRAEYLCGERSRPRLINLDSAVEGRI